MFLPVLASRGLRFPHCFLNPPDSYIMSPPDFDGAVLRSRVEQPVPSPPETGDRLRVPSEDTLTAACSCVPHPYAAILGAAGQVAALGVPGEGKGDVTSLLTCLITPVFPRHLSIPNSRVRDNVLTAS